MNLLKNKIKFMIHFAVISLMMFGASDADVITLSNGTKISCVVIAKDTKALLADTEFGGMTINLKSIADIKTDDEETNFILRGDFFAKKGKLEDALRLYGEAMLANPKSQNAKNKYNDIRKRMEELNKLQMNAFAKQAEVEPKVTREDVEAAQAKKKLDGNATISLQATGTGFFPLLTPRGKSKDKIALEVAKHDALNKIFGKGYGIGFEASGDKVKIYPDGEIPRCKVEVTNKQKYDKGYQVTVQVTGPTETLMLNLPEDYPIIEVMGHTPDIKAITQEEVQMRALRDAVERAVKNSMTKKAKEDPKTAKKKYYGRAFPVEILNSGLTPSGYVMRVKLKLWFDPAS